MKKIVFLSFTFLGICTASAQKPVEKIPLDSLGKVAQTNTPSVKNDSLAGKEKPLIRLSPNPTVNKIEIEIKGFDPGDVQIHITDINGNKVKSDKRLVFGGDEIIVLMFSIPPGIYLLQVSQYKKQARAKFIVR